MKEDRRIAAFRCIGFEHWGSFVLEFLRGVVSSVLEFLIFFPSQLRDQSSRSFTPTVCSQSIQARPAPSYVASE
jgi:hypothetical protein